VQERTAGAVWAMAGDNIEERLLMAERISARLLIDFVVSSSPLLNLIGAEGLYALCTGPLGQHDAVAAGGGVPALIYLVRRPTDTDHTALIAGRPVRRTTAAAVLRVTLSMRPAQGWLGSRVVSSGGSTLGPGGAQGSQIVARPPTLAVLLTRSGQLILRKISKFDATIYETFGLKCTKFDFRWSLALDPSAP